MNPEISITYSKKEPYYFMKEPHQHDYYEVYFLISGYRRFFIEDTIYKINKGELIFIHRNILHKTSYISDESHQRFGLYINANYMDTIMEDLGVQSMEDLFKQIHIRLNKEQTKFIERLLWKIKSEYPAFDEYSSKILKSYINQFFIFILRSIKASTDRTNRLSQSNHFVPSNSVCQKTAKYIFRHYDKPLTLESVARYAGLSPTYFSKKFLADTGFTFIEYLSHVRIKHACELLAQTQKPITEIAFLCGYNDSNYFGDVFKKTKGLSPSKYRKEHRLN